LQLLRLRQIHNGGTSCGSEEGREGGREGGREEGEEGGAERWITEMEGRGRGGGRSCRKKSETSLRREEGRREFIGILLSTHLPLPLSLPPSLPPLVFIKLNGSTINLLRWVEPYIAYGYPNLKSVRELIYKRGYAKVRPSSPPLSLPLVPTMSTASEKTDSQIHLLTPPYLLFFLSRSTSNASP
jgi:hypothetical protein